MKRFFVAGALVLAAAAAFAAGAVTIVSPTAGAPLESGRVVHIEWKNNTTTPADVYVIFGEHRTNLVAGDAASEGMSMWRVPAEGGEYTLVVEASNGAKASTTLVVGGAAVTEPKVYPSPNPLNLAAGDTSVTFASAPSGSKATIYDLQGLTVAELEGDPLKWDGRNGRGDVVAGGTYLYQLITPGGELFTGKIAVVK